MNQESNFTSAVSREASAKENSDTQNQNTEKSFEQLLNESMEDSSSTEERSKIVEKMGR